MTPIKHISAVNSSNEALEAKIKGMFYLLQTSTEKFLEELDRSYELYKIGEKTKIAQKLEEIASESEPGSMETDLIAKLLNTLNGLGKKVVVDGFLLNSKLIETAVVLSENDSRIFYGVVPKSGKENQLREAISDFYAETSHWQMFKYTEPLFQVIQPELLSEIKYQEKIVG